MTFAAQTRWCLSRAGWAGLAAVAGLGILALGGLPGLLSDLVAFAVTLLLAGAGMLILAGAVMRPLQKWVWHRAIEPNALYRGWVLRVPALRAWLWIDEAGRDRDV